MASGFCGGIQTNVVDMYVCCSLATHACNRARILITPTTSPPNPVVDLFATAIQGNLKHDFVLIDNRRPSGVRRARPLTGNNFNIGASTRKGTKQGLAVPALSGHHSRPRKCLLAHPSCPNSNGDKRQSSQVRNR